MLNLLINAYTDPDAPRERELCEALSRNLQIFDRLIYWHDSPGISITSRETSIKLGGNPRPTVAQLLAAVNGCIGPADVTVLANCDICFDDSIRQAEPNPDECFALTRWETATRPDGKIFVDDNGNPRTDSQDAWIFRGPIRPDLLPGGKHAPEFTLGVRGCDNALAYRIRAAGYRVSNPSLSIRAWHHHATQLRRYSHDVTECVGKPYLLIHPHALGAVASVDVRF